jgi:hypothetical protein
LLKSSGSFTFMRKNQSKNCTVAALTFSLLAGAVANAHSQISVTNPLALSGTWYNPATGGQGFVFDIAPNNDGTAFLFGGWFTFNTPDIFLETYPIWFSLQGRFNTNQDDFFQPNRPNITVPIFNNGATAYDAIPLTKLTQAGTAHIQFQDCTHATLDYDFSSGSVIFPGFAATTGSIPLVRLTGDSGCNSAPALTVAKSSRGFSGTWYNPATSGQGFVFDVNPITNGGYIFGGWFYRSAGATAWFSMQGAFEPAATEADVPFYCAPGGVFDSAERAGKSKKCGTSHLQFTSCSTATLTYTFAAEPPETIPLQRLTPIPADCPLQ